MFAQNLPCLCALLLALAFSAQAETRELIAYQLEDQFDQEHTDADVRGHVAVVTGSDKNGSSFNGGWAKAIIEDLKRDVGIDGVRFVAVADLRGVPFFLKGMIKGKFPREPKSWVLMDWKGLFATTYGYQAKASNILVFGPGGDLLIKAHGREVEAEKLALIVARIRDGLGRQVEVPQVP